MAVVESFEDFYVKLPIKIDNNELWIALDIDQIVLAAVCRYNTIRCHTAYTHFSHILKSFEQIYL